MKKLVAKPSSLASHHTTCNLPASAQEIVSIDKQQALIALGRFKSCVRTSLLLCDGYECQEKEGTFLVAFASPRAAVEWALTLQLALMKYCQKLPRYAAICHALLSYVMFCSSCAVLDLPAIFVSRYAVPHYTADSMLHHPILCHAEPFATLCHTATPPLQCIVLFCVDSCHHVPCFAILCHAMLC